MLGNPHGIVNSRPNCITIKESSLDDVSFGNTCNLFPNFRRIFLKTFLKGFKSLCPSFNEFLINQTFLYYHMHNRIQKGYISTRPMLKPQGTEPHKVNSSRVNNNEFRTFSHCLFYFQTYYGMRLCCV